MSPKLKGSVCVVTGGSNGIGRGIALQLGAAGAKVYFTGRSQECLDQVAAEIKTHGGDPVPVRLDHNNDAEVENFFRKIEKDEKGKLDLLVNNAFAGGQALIASIGKPYWEADPAVMWDSLNGVGLRGHYVCTVFATRIMIKNGKGLIVNISSYGGLHSIDTPAYGIGKTATDRMAADCALELRDKNVGFVSVWPNVVKTDACMVHYAPLMPEAFEDAESPEFIGMGIVHLASDPNYISKSGKILKAWELAKEYGFVDFDGRIHEDKSTLGVKPWLVVALDNKI